ncbi:hypothetical protein OSB04_022851 [Centaurea solstitialis]|uniref:Myb-like domain-containing protein n=1 Tax=Centaurea solstitialis TaxID=347529 RepID=A0AA38SJP0_9ASTR|nr:hypothetical protein OSB04_022851 [Centaurea solstitialis]
MKNTVKKPFVFDLYISYTHIYMDISSHLHHTIEGGGSGDRFPQWSMQETKDLLVIRGELDSSFMETKRNKRLWEVISTKMKERGYNRSAEQCKNKWKNILTRYKGYETIEQESMRHEFPFYDELQVIFTNRMQRILGMEVESIPSGSNKRGMEFSSNEEDENEDRLVEKASYSSKKKQKPIDNRNNDLINNLKEVLDEYMKRQMDIETQSMKRYEAIEEERRMKEMEWRQKMEALRKERIMLDERWREREEKRRNQEEARIEKRDALITTLLEKLRSQGHH